MDIPLGLRARWTAASFAVAGMEAPLGGHLTYRIQAAGRMEEKLRGLDLHYGAIIEQRNQTNVDMGLDEYLHHSLLWVLDAYELVRTLDSCISNGLWSPSHAVRNELARLKARLAEVRMPLAKFESKGKSRSARPGDLIAHPVHVYGTGAGWTFADSPDKVVSRQSLADELLDFLEMASNLAGSSG